MHAMMQQQLQTTVRSLTGVLFVYVHMCWPHLQDGGVKVNAAKAEIDSLTEQLDVKKAAAGSSGSTGGEPGVLDDETYQLLQQLKAAKAR